MEDAGWISHAADDAGVRIEAVGLERFGIGGGRRAEGCAADRYKDGVIWSRR